MDVPKLSPRDTALQASLPALCVPHDSGLPPLEAGQRRLLLASDGVYLQARSLVMLASVRIAQATLPYGPHAQSVVLTNGQIPAALIAQAAQAARATPEKEIAAAVVWEDGAYRLVFPEVISADAGHISYRDQLDDSHLVLDLHSHGGGSAYFSPQDDESDRSRPGPYIAGVFGRCAGAMEFVARIVCAPHLVDLPVQVLAPGVNTLVAPKEPSAAPVGA